MGRAARAGVSLPELLIVIALLGLAAMIAIPLTARRVHELRVRSAAQQFVTSLRAARMAAVATGRSFTVTLSPHGLPQGVIPEDSYTYDGLRPRYVALPPGVRIDPSSTTSIVFRPNGSLEAPTAATAIFKAKLWDGVERWTVEVPLIGIPRMTHETVENDGDDW